MDTLRPKVWTTFWELLHSRFSPARVLQSRSCDRDERTAADGSSDSICSRIQWRRMGMREGREEERTKNKIDMPHRGRWTVRGQERFPLPHSLSFLAASPRSPSNGRPMGCIEIAGGLRAAFMPFFLSLFFFPILVSFFLLSFSVATRWANVTRINGRHPSRSAVYSGPPVHPVPPLLCSRISMCAHNCTRPRSTHSDVNSSLPVSSGLPCISPIGGGLLLLSRERCTWCIAR